MRSVLLILSTVILSLNVSNVRAEENVAQGVRVIVLDAGHGGPKYPGARYDGINEKDINLQVVRKLGALLEKNLPDVKIVYTRTIEKQFSENLGVDLQSRADIANKADGDLFISIHSNASRDRSVKGVETLIMGESSMETRVNENILFANNKEEFLDMSDKKTAAVVRAYIQNLQFTYGEYSEMMARLVQKQYAKIGRVSRGVRHQPLRVLYATDMPSILTEIGFMSNPDELHYITSEKGQNEIANAIFQAVREYIAYVRKSLLTDASAESVSVQSESENKEVTDDKHPVIPVNKPVSEPKYQGQTQKVSSPSQETKQPVKSVAPSSSATSDKLYFTIQIMASAQSKIAQKAIFGGYASRVRELKGTGALPFKYCIGEYSSKADAQKELTEIRKIFGGAFVVAAKGNRIQ